MILRTFVSVRRRVVRFVQLLRRHYVGGRGWRVRARRLLLLVLLLLTRRWVSEGQSHAVATGTWRGTSGVARHLLSQSGAPIAEPYLQRNDIYTVNDMDLHWYNMVSHCPLVFIYFDINLKINSNLKFEFLMCTLGGK